MSTDLNKAYELLGVKPGVPIRELKAAHRDLAKVWHPDRFQHDPRLQEKAQEKLKEINEAYDLLISGKEPRPRPVSAEAPRAAYSAPAPAPAPTATAHSTGSWKWVAIMLVFAGVFAFTTRSLLQRRQPVAQPESEQQVQTDQQASTRPDARTRADATRKASHDDAAAAAPEVETSSAPPIETQPAAMPTVSVTIDPASGLLAKPDCPVRSRMTYPRGSEPTAHCNINHTPPSKDSKIKSLAEKILK